MSQSYLRTFAADPPRRKRIWRFSKNHDAGEGELKLIEKVAVRYHLYAPVVPATGLRDDSFERKLSDLEQWFGAPIWKQLCNDFVDMSWEPLRKMIALLVAVMQFRNPAHLEVYEGIQRQLIGLYAGLERIPTSYEFQGKVYPLNPDSWPAFRDATSEDRKRAWIESISSAAWYAELLMKMRWSIICAEEPVFITTDNPVTILHPSLRFRGINNPKTALMFPISPTRLLNMDHIYDEPANQYYPLKGDGAVLNMLLWRGATEYMFSHRPTDEVCAAIVADAERQGFA